MPAASGVPSSLPSMHFSWLLTLLIELKLLYAKRHVDLYHTYYAEHNHVDPDLTRTEMSFKLRGSICSVFLI